MQTLASALSENPTKMTINTLEGKIGEILILPNFGSRKTDEGVVINLTALGKLNPKTAEGKIQKLPDLDHSQTREQRGGSRGNLGLAEAKHGHSAHSCHRVRQPKPISAWHSPG